MLKTGYGVLPQQVQQNNKREGDASQALFVLNLHSLKVGLIRSQESENCVGGLWICRGTHMHILYFNLEPDIFILMFS